MTIGTRPISLDEAVNLVLNSQTQEYRLTCIEIWKRSHGQQFAQAVIEGVKRKRRGGKR